MHDKTIYITDYDAKRLRRLLGYRAGDTISWEVPAGVRRIKILDILYQPEASGDYHL